MIVQQNIFCIFKRFYRFVSYFKLLRGIFSKNHSQKYIGNSETILQGKSNVKNTLEISKTFYQIIDNTVQIVVKYG